MKAQPVVLRDPRLGGLGNQLWRIAGTVGIAARLSTAAHIGQWPYSPYFNLPARYFQWRDGIDAVMIPQHIAPQHRKYLQDPSLWIDIRHQIRDYFSPSQLAINHLEKRHAALLATPRKIAVHVRRGDYLGVPDFHPVCTQRYYRAALDRLPAGNVVIFSDDVPWCAEHLSWMNPVAITGPPAVGRHQDLADGTECLDLFLMTRCDYHVIANSSFSWWGAFLSGNSAPIHPLTWYGPGFSDIDANLMFLPGWVGIES